VPPTRRGNLPVVVLCAGLAAVANPMGLRMAGDMQKNSAALGLALLFVYFADRYLREHRLSAAVGALLSLLLTGLTHLGVFGMTLVLAALLGTVAVWDSRNRKRLLVGAAVAAVVCLVAALAVFAFFDPTRIERLTGYLLSPGRLFLRPGPPGGPGGPGPGPMGVPPLLAMRPESLPGLALGILGLWMWLLLLEVDRVQRHTVLACGLAALALACPWINPDMGTRLALMSVLPGVVCVVFALAHWPRVWGCAVAGGATAALLLAGSVRMLHVSPPGTLSSQSVAELRELAGKIKDPARTLIVARHGLEWWAAGFTGAHIANNLNAALSVWDRYDQVYSLVETAPGQVPGLPGGPRPMGPGRGPGAGAPGLLPGGPPGPGGPGPGLGPQPGFGDPRAPQPGMAGRVPEPGFADPRQPQPGQPGRPPEPGFGDLRLLRRPGSRPQEPRPPRELAGPDGAPAPQRDARSPEPAGPAPGLGPQGPPPGDWDQDPRRPGPPGLGLQGPPPDARDRDPRWAGPPGAAPGPQGPFPQGREVPRPGLPGPGGPGPGGDMAGPRPALTEPVYSGTALRLEQFRSKPPAPPSRPARP
jgi:hypothetical protein